MATVMIDTLRITRRRRDAGASEPIAEAVANTIAEQSLVAREELATKADLAALAATTKADLPALKFELKADNGVLENRILKIRKPHFRRAEPDAGLDRGDCRRLGRVRRHARQGALARAMLIKICGVTTPPTLAATLAARATHVGFVFFPPSPRHLAPAHAAGLAAQAGALIRVGLFVDADDALIDAAIAAAGLHALQLHGDETPARVAGLKARTRLEVWKAVPIRTRTHIAATASWRGIADRVLLDAKPPPGAVLPGGNGVRFDWGLLGEVKPPLPWGLSGGLEPLNVAEAIRATGAPLVDVSSGVETAPGVKSSDLIRAFLEAAHSA